MKLLITLALIALGLGCASAPDGMFYEGPAEAEYGAIYEAAPAEADNLLDERMIVSTASIQIRTLYPDSVHKRVIAIAAGAGGYVVESADGATTIRIPSGGYHSVLEQIELLGEVIDRQIQGRDVTEEYHDLGTRLDNAEKTRQRYLALLDQATTLDQMMKVERELERINARIESLKGQIERMSHLVAMATITVRTKEGIKPGPLGWVFAKAFEGVKWLFVRE